MQLHHSFTAKNGNIVTLRPAKEKDADDIITSVKEIVEAGEYLQKETARSLEEELSFINEMKEKGNMYTVVEVGGKAVGICRIVKSELEMKKHTGNFRTWISSDGQGLGISHEIMSYSINWASENGLYKIWLTVFAENEIAVKVYKKAGFIEEGRQKGQVKINGQLQDEILMAYFL
ncbi:GNAT family N-acetyltransferase [Fictibacillus aquaticus]|uniref:GNAT family N-acetyltransferase n=1 Tax=Fictibacillus aquaticus TaxID=2021314 RepID=UPI001F0A5B42|nr:GNAT family protein [Fictibacillus aquaticus]